MAVMFNGTNLESAFVVSNVVRPLPEFRATSTSVEGADGEVFDALTLGIRECAFELWAIDKSQRGLQDAARAIMEIYAVREPKALQFSDERDGNGYQLTRYAVPTGFFDSEGFMRSGMWTCRFVMHDPYLYGKSRSVVLQTGTTRIETGGSAMAYPVIEATPAAGGGYFGIAKNEENSSDAAAWFSYYANFTGQTKITVDMARQRCWTVSEGDGIRLGSRFFGIEGTENLRLVNGTAVVSWTERWL